MTTVDPTPAAPPLGARLRRLYLVRFVVAVVWAALLAVTVGTAPIAAAILLVLYPLFDVAAAVVDHRASRATRPGPLLFVNMGLSLATAIGLAVSVAVAGDLGGAAAPAVLRIWGAWAITAGAVQLIVALLRYRLGGQWAMILSGGISVLAGIGFVTQAGGSMPSLIGLAGYAVLGGVFFLVSALRLRR